MGGTVDHVIAKLQRQVSRIESISGELGKIEG